MMRFPEQFRYTDAKNRNRQFATKPGDRFGYFVVPPDKAKGRALRCVACEAHGNILWDHVSVSLVGWEHKTPSWDEMCLVKDLFWGEEDCVVQFHPPRSRYVNTHPGVLHLWRNVVDHLGAPRTPTMPPVELV